MSIDAGKNFFQEYFLDIIKNKYLDANGRARRKEYWMFALCSICLYMAILLLAVILSLISDTLGTIVMVLYLLVALALIAPNICLTIRRLHDLGKSGFYFFVTFIPFVGGFILLYFLVIEGTVGDNLYGPDPKAGERGSIPSA